MRAGKLIGYYWRPMIYFCKRKFNPFIINEKKRMRGVNSNYIVIMIFTWEEMIIDS